MQNLILNLHSRTQLVIRDSFSDHRIRLDRLAELTGAALDQTPLHADAVFAPQNEVPSAARGIRQWHDAALYFLPDEKTFFLVPDEHKWQSGSDEFLVHLWQMSVEVAVISQMYRGADLLMIHGALLDTVQGGVLLCGQSGMGKSTSSRRWRAAGGKVFSDDMILLEFHNGEICAHPLPTWSRCRESLKGEYFPFSSTIPLRRVIALARGKEREELKSVSETEYFMSIYSASAFFYSTLVKVLTTEEQQFLLQQVRTKAAHLAQLTPPLALFAHLDADLKETLRDFLP